MTFKWQGINRSLSGVLHHFLHVFMVGSGIFPNSRVFYLQVGNITAEVCRAQTVPLTMLHQSATTAFHCSYQFDAHQTDSSDRLTARVRGGVDQECCIMSAQYKWDSPAFVKSACTGCSWYSKNSSRIE